MQNINQQTLKSPINFEGIGLHTGSTSKVKIIPTNENTGIVFKRIDLNEKNIIRANLENVSCTKLCTTITNSSGASVSTIEHLMAALYITGIDNVLIETNSSELPIMDGSSKEFVEMIEKSGLKIQSAKRKFIKIIKKTELHDGEKSISIDANEDGLNVEFELSYSNTVIGSQKNSVSFYNEKLNDIYSSRTFCLFEDIEKIKKAGFAKGGSLDNAIVVKDDVVLNDKGLRNQKEFVNHKILDLAGDFLLSGYRILGNVKCFHGGHYLSNIFLKKLFKDKSNYKEITFSNVEVLNKKFKSAANRLVVNG
ncbi:UDP-3-O-acyl-N-acetylglucosamine deacetylase [Pelagibacteraceae bacterium]|nr:UDP-3-O-acyl-N-acetylglucosamine deacetylase [Pelagibacteraceae bacterium]